METPKKSAFWTQHVDLSSGVSVCTVTLDGEAAVYRSRTYLFNMALGRSYWELPVEIQAQAKTPILDALREWDSEAAERKYGVANQQAGDDDKIRKRREEALAKSRAAAEAQSASTTLSLDERMNLAAQKRKAAEVQSSTRLSSCNVESSNEYLELVRQLQQNDDGEEGGGKWLVR